RSDGRHAGRDRLQSRGTPALSRAGIPALGRGLRRRPARSARRFAALGGDRLRGRCRRAERKGQRNRCMSVHSTSPEFKQNAARALADPALQKALKNVEKGFVKKRALAAGKLPEFEALRDSARDLKDHALANLDLYLEAYEAKVLELGGKVHW